MGLYKIPSLGNSLGSQPRSSYLIKLNSYNIIKPVTKAFEMTNCFNNEKFKRMNLYISTIFISLDAWQKISRLYFTLLQ